MSGYFEGSTPVGIWIVGELSRPRDCRLFFPGDGREFPHIRFDTVDRHEAYLSRFDQAGIRVFLQVEPAHADLPTLIDLVLGRYKHHPCVIGFGVDVEWNREADHPERGAKVDDATAREWEARVKSHNPQYRLFLKHWDYRWMPKRYRGDIVFVDDGQIVESLDVLVEAFVNRWAKRFYPNTVLFQVGYPSDRHWWQKLGTPPQTIGNELRKRIKQDLGVIWVDFTLREALPVEGEKDRRVVGVKIYEHGGDFGELLGEWRSLGVNTALVSPALASNPDFRSQAKRDGIAMFIIFPVFYNPEELKKRPDLYALTAAGERAVAEWVEFVCPTRKEYRRKKVEEISRLVRETAPEGISLDFIRYFVYWEKVSPERTLDSLPQTCFCEYCLREFQKKADIEIPRELTSTAEKAAWILSRHLAEWRRWKGEVISSMAAELAAEARKIEPGIEVNIHAVPWRREDFGGAIETIAGQNLATLASAADFISPMCYHHMLFRQPAWIHDVVLEMTDRTHGRILPSIQVKEAYREAKLSALEFKAALEEALKPPSRGVIFWSWPALAEDPEKKAIVRSLLHEART